MIYSVLILENNDDPKCLILEYQKKKGSYEYIGKTESRFSELQFTKSRSVCLLSLYNESVLELNSNEALQEQNIDNYLPGIDINDIYLNIITREGQFLNQIQNKKSLLALIEAFPLKDRILAVYFGQRHAEALINEKLELPTKVLTEGSLEKIEDDHHPYHLPLKAYLLGQMGVPITTIEANQTAHNNYQKAISWLLRGTLPLLLLFSLVRVGNYFLERENSELLLESQFLKQERLVLTKNRAPHSNAYTAQYPIVNLVDSISFLVPGNLKLSGIYINPVSKQDRRNQFEVRDTNKVVIYGSSLKQDEILRLILNLNEMSRLSETNLKFINSNPKKTDLMFFKIESSLKS